MGMRRLPCRWHEKQIVVLDSVMISEPYGLAEVKGNDKKAVERVKHVVWLSTHRGNARVLISKLRQLEGERRKLGTAKRMGTPVSTGGDRKGG